MVYSHTTVSWCGFEAAVKMGVSSDTSHQYIPEDDGSKLSIVMEFSVDSVICNNNIL